MLGANRSVTIVNFWYDGAADADREVSTTLDGVSIYVEAAASLASDRPEEADLAKIRIPYRLGYLSQEQWLDQQKSDSPEKDVWTLRVGDTVVIDGQRKTILRFRDNTARPFSPHWYVEAR